MSITGTSGFLGSYLSRYLVDSLAIAFTACFEDRQMIICYRIIGT